MPSEACQFYGRTRMKRVGLEIESFKTICGPIPFLKDYHAGTPSSPAGLHVNWIPSWAQGKKPGHGSSNQTGLFVPYSREMAPHSRVRAWRTPGTEEPGGLPSVGSYRVGHDWSDAAAAYIFICMLYIWVLYIVVWQKPTQHCKTIFHQLKKIKGKKKMKKLKWWEGKKLPSGVRSWTTGHGKGWDWEPRARISLLHGGQLLFLQAWRDEVRG